jgi:ATP-dependent Lhr-like helicase
MCIAIIQLYLEERWIEPINTNTLPYGLLYHQTMSFMVTSGDVSPALLAQTMLTLGAFKNISQSDFKLLLNYMIKMEQLEIDEQKKLIVGLRGERETNRFDFYAVFATENEFTVKFKTEEIGTIHKEYPVKTKFALAGYTWEVIEIDKKSQIIYVNKVEGISTNSWVNSGALALHTKILKKMKEVLCSDTEYKYLGENAKSRLQEIRAQFSKMNLRDEMVVSIERSTYGVFPFLGTKAINALSYALTYYGLNNNIYFDGVIPVCIIIKTNVNMDEIKRILCKIKISDLDKTFFSVPQDAAISGKYNEFVPEVLLRKQYMEDYIDVEDMKNSL